MKITPKVIFEKPINLSQVEYSKHDLLYQHWTAIYRDSSHAIRKNSNLETLAYHSM